MEKLFEVECAGTLFRVYDDCVSLSPKGFLGFASKGLAGERKLFYKDISSVQFKESTKLLSGFIEFYVIGVNAKQGGGLFAGTNNENRFTFYNKSLSEMQKAYEYIHNKINNQKEETKTSAQPAEIDSFTEIKKYKQLLDEGIITEEEFNAKKKQLLGL